MSNEHNGPGMFPEATEVERLLQQMATTFPQTMEEEAREPQEYLTGEVLSPQESRFFRYEHPICPYCGQRHPQISRSTSIFEESGR